MNEVFILCIFCCSFIIIYFIPSIISFKVKHLEKYSIFFLNLFLGFTFIGWIIALLWSLSNSQKHYVRKLEESHRMGLISDYDFEQKLKQLQKR